MKTTRSFLRTYAQLAVQGIKPVRAREAVQQTPFHLQYRTNTHGSSKPAPASGTDLHRTG